MTEPRFTVAPLSGGEAFFLRCLADATASVALKWGGGVVATGRVVGVENDTVVLLPPNSRYEERVSYEEFDEVEYQ